MSHLTGEIFDLQTALAGEYSFQREIGRGGMGIVYLARDVQLNRDVAIKVLPPNFTRLSDSRKRFLKEARTAAGLSHPHIVPIHRVGEASGFVFFVMSFIEGESLGDRLRSRGPLLADEASRVMREVAWALAYAHGRGVIHRDVKADNILIETGTGRALVTDFGIAHAQENELASSLAGEIAGEPTSEPVDGSGITESSNVMGTISFMSPEQAVGGSLDGRSDLYSLGVVGYLSISGQLPYVANSLAELIVRQSKTSAKPVRLVSPGTPVTLAAAIDRCLERDAAMRFQSGEALAEALTQTAVVKPSLPPTLRSWLAARNPLLVPYMGWSGGFTLLTTINIIAWNATGNSPNRILGILMLGAFATAPILPIVGFHLHQAKRQFKAGHSLADLRRALDFAREERRETESLTNMEQGTLVARTLRGATLASVAWLISTFALTLGGVIHEKDLHPIVFVAPFLSTLLFGAISNALDVAFIPRRIRKLWQEGVRERLWRSKVGTWIAKRLGAPEESSHIDSSAFRPTESVLTVAASELFEALPAEYKRELAGILPTVKALEARAATARAELDHLDILLQRAPSEGAQLLDSRKTRATVELKQSVAALEEIRIDLLRVHAGNTDLSSLTTLINAAHEAGDELRRLADAQNEVNNLIAGNSDLSQNTA